MNESVWDNNTLWAPVAEYKGVALLERPGNVKSAWKGCHYTTDGHVWLWCRGRDAEGKIKVIGVPSERTVKAHLDELGEPAKVYMSMKECCEVMGRTDVAIPAFRWDDVAGVFVVDDGLKDGQHRL